MAEKEAMAWGHASGGGGGLFKGRQSFCSGFPGGILVRGRGAKNILFSARAVESG